MPKLYSYVGSLENLSLLARGSTRLCVNHSTEIAVWARETYQDLKSGVLTVTFIVDEYGKLWINDRRTEHVVCANGGRVLAAGELGFDLDGGRVTLREASNQSTGYCPEPSSWGALASELQRLGLAIPSGYARNFEFRFCHGCNNINIVRESWFVCVLCDAELDPV